MKTLRTIGVVAALALAFGLGVITQRNAWLPGSSSPEERSETTPKSERPRGGLVTGGDVDGRWHVAREFGQDPALLPDDLGDLLAIPYAQGTHGANDEGGVRRHVRSRVAPGDNVFSSGHAPVAYLIDSEGAVRHTWRLAGEDVWPEIASTALAPKLKFWRRVHLFENGDLLAIYEGVGLIRIDAGSQLLWSFRGGAHHDLDVDLGRDIWVLTRASKQLPAEGRLPERQILEDFITRLSPDGTELERISIPECFRSSEYAGVLDGARNFGDIYHTNTITLLSGETESPLDQAGHLLISVRELNTVAIIDPKERTVTWSLTGLWRGQHQPVLLDTGRLLVFDNLAGPERSRVVELDPFTHAIAWRYEGTAEEPFYSRFCGSNQRLSNGNTLITESDYGRAFEVDPSGKIVWEYVNPNRAGRRGELIATLFEMVRLPEDFPVEHFASRRGR